LLEPPGFDGASATLRRGGIRDIVFEDLFTDARAYPTPAVRILQGFGYTVFALAKRFRGPALGRPCRLVRRLSEEPREPAGDTRSGACARLRARGWLSLRSTRFRATPAS